MTSLRHDTISAETAFSLQVSQDIDAHPNVPPRRTLSLMRRYEVAALLPDLTIASKQLVAPATPLFEETASAFARGTLIPTVRGPVAIEDLLPGDYIETTEGSEPIMWIGSTTYVPGHEDDATTLTGLTRITADAFGLGRPGVDLLVGPAARMPVRHEKLSALLGQDTVLAPVWEYADGDRFLPVTPGGAVQLFHLMLSRHGLIRIGGVEMETYHPGNAAGANLGHNMRSLFMSMFDCVENLDDFGHLSITRTRREVIDSLIDR